MRSVFVFICFASLTTLAAGQQPTMPTGFGEGQQSGATSAEAKQKEMWESKIKAEWEAIKNRDKKAYGEILADDYQGVAVDGKGERNKTQALNELMEENSFTYTLWGLKLIPVGSDGTLLIYEVTLQFPPKSQLRYSRFYISELWLKRGGEWKEVHYQETHVK